ncbi:probable serine/threonine-protein kinase At1g09600 [Cornus florida]|uniref:probable serine/threonine-protein kinase At1g09600 n=1 Tax=Cornus florida TaxID=4283 RepID=UPI0028A27F52|nr:probable serine/threonine-protein kinase At1g09600 [Cornus florida]
MWVKLQNQLKRRFVVRNKRLRRSLIMGCIYSKGSSANAHIENNGKEKEKEKDKESKKSSKKVVASSRKEEVVVDVDNSSNDATARLIKTQPTEEIVASTPSVWDDGEKKAMVVEKPEKARLQRGATIDAGVNGGQPMMIRVLSTRNGVEGAHVAAGWPSWLTAVAGEAIQGWVPRKADSFEKLDKIGQGTYSSVYRARDLETGKIVALKKVRFVKMDPDSVRFMAREIHILRRLDHPNVMKLEGLVTSRVSGNLYLVFEYMEHDLAGLAASSTTKFTESQIKCYMQQLFRGLEHCHSRGVLHRDIKGANLLIDNKGNLKIGDFGLATFYRSHENQPLTSRVVTLWYRPPELLLGATDYGVSVDLWSAGCILAELFAGKPIMPGRTEVEQLHKIFKLCGSPSEDYWKKSKLPHATIFKPQQPYKRCFAETFKDFPSSALTLLDVLLSVEPENRGSASSTLQSEFFTTKPLPCNPSSLPKYSPSKEFDVKLREEEARRQKVAAVTGRGIESCRKGFKESKALPVRGANAELQESMMKQKGESNPKSKKSNAEEGGDGSSVFVFEPSRGRSQTGVSHSGRLAQPGTFGSLINMNVNESLKPEGAAAQLSRYSSSVAVRGSTRFDLSSESSASPHWPEGNARYNQLDVSGSSVKRGWFHNLWNRPNSSSKKDERESGKESSMVGSSKKNRIHYSGPLLPPGGNLDEMLRDHERRIQQAVRKARIDVAKTRKKYSGNGQTASLMHHGGNG